MKDIRVRVETYDGCCTVWYERSKLKNATDVICNRVTNQLMGLNIKRVEVDVIQSYDTLTTGTRPLAETPQGVYSTNVLKTHPFR